MQLIIIIFIIGVICKPLQLDAQDRKAFKKDFQEADYFLLNEEFEEAAFLFNELLKRDPVNANLQFLLGASYLSIEGKKKLAIPHLEKAVSSMSAGYRVGSFREKNAPRETLFALARAYHINNQFDEAIEYYDRYKTVMRITDAAQVRFIEKHVASVKLARELIRDTIFVDYDVVFDDFNNTDMINRAVFAEKDSVMVFMTRKPYFLPIMSSRMEDGRWSEPLQLNDQLEVSGNYRLCDISHDGTELYLSIRRDLRWDLYVSYFENGRWSPIQELKVINTRYNETHASITHNKRRMYFTSDRPGGIGIMDIYYSDRDERGNWGPPVNLGKPVNGIYSEETPFITADEKTLFFSSSSHPSMGGFDVFYSTRLPDGRWSYPANMGFPVNTTDDDVFFYPLADGSQAIYISNDELLPQKQVIALNFIQEEGMWNYVLRDETLDIKKPGYNDADSLDTPGIISRDVIADIDAMREQDDLDLEFPLESVESFVQPGDQPEPVVMAGDQPEPVLIVEEQPEPFVMAEEQPEPVVMAGEQPEPVLIVEEQPEPFVMAEEQPEPVVMAEEQPEPVVMAGEQPGPVVMAGEQPEPVLIVEEQPEPFVMAEEQPEPVLIVEEQPEPVVMAGEQPKPVVMFEEDTETVVQTGRQPVTNLLMEEGAELLVSEEQHRVAGEGKEKQEPVELDNENRRPSDQEEERDEEYILSRSILFSFDSHQLTATARFELEKLHALMFKYPYLHVEVTGYTDALGSADYNLQLSRNRSLAVVNYLVSKGTPRENFIARGAGKTGFVAKNFNEDGTDNPEGRRLNRRADINPIHAGDMNIVMLDMFIPEHLKAEAAKQYYVLLDELESLQVEFPVTMAGQDIILKKTGREYIYAVGGFNSKRDAMMFLNGMKDVDFPDGRIVTESDVDYLLKPSVPDTLEITGPFTIQLLALSAPVRKNIFQPDEPVTVIEGVDGLYRYITGVFTSYTEAQKSLVSFVKRGFTDAYINPVSRYDSHQGIEALIGDYVGLGDNGSGEMTQ